jgi:hypothetical protein
MKKNTPAPEVSPWDAVPVTPEQAQAEIPKPTKQQVIAQSAGPAVEFDMEGLMTDFPTAKELERFVYDQTGRVLNLKGRANKLKYQVAMDVLNGRDIDPVFVGGDNPYIEKADLVPVEELRPVPARDASLPSIDQVQNNFVSRLVPHPDEEFRANMRRVDCVFRKYRNGMISYEVLGPIDQRPEGEKMDKFGRMRPEIIRWVDPRTGEQLVVRADGTMTPQGRNLRAMMQKLRFNDSNWWDVFVDREFAEFAGGELSNPWDLRE